MNPVGRRGGGTSARFGGTRFGGTRFPGSGTRFGGGAASHGCFERDAAFFSDGGGDRDDAFFLRGPAKPHGFLPLNGGGAGSGAAPHPTDADVVADALALRGTELELYEPGGFGDRRVDDVDVEALDRPRRNRTPAVFLSKTPVEWTTSVTAREVPTPGSEKRGMGHPLVVDITFKAYCAFSGDVDTWREVLTPGVVFYMVFEAASFCVWALGIYRLFLGKDEGPHWMKNFYRWQMDVPTLEEFLAEEERLNELEEREEAEAEARERAAKKSGGEGAGETAAEDRAEDRAEDGSS